MTRRVPNLTLLLLLTLVKISGGFPNGAPYSMCGYYKPSHATPEPHPHNTSPYRLIVSAQYFDFREPEHDYVVVNITSREGGPPFKGFVVASYDGSGKPYGSWDPSPLAHQVPRCKKPAITHNDAMPKYLTTLVWRPPKDEQQEWGWLQFRATVVKDLHNFWSELPHEVLM
ncbi:putative defense protein Hdd11 [Homarus americanus]|uniref:Defense protein 3-like n=1 Tax=Homarus americanus TaxID=6706 RepID=A0A8J5MY31_HOMAM|nr:putative defense protein Hdd11 [Homarus americanus]KAG7168665.1 defense protein 3-like [Homarus americanus]